FSRLSTLRPSVLSTPFPYTTLFRSDGRGHRIDFTDLVGRSVWLYPQHEVLKDLIRTRVAENGRLHFGVSDVALDKIATTAPEVQDRKSTRLNSSHVSISYAVVCIKK